MKGQFSTVRGFSYLYGLNTLEDLFFDHKTVLLYLLVELVEILMVSHQESPNMSFAENPLARFLKEILVSSDLKALSAEFLVNENGIEDILAFLRSNADLSSTLLRRSFRTQDILAKRREELRSMCHSTLNDFFRSLSREFSLFIENVTKSSSDIGKLMLVLLEDNGYHYIEHIHSVLLVVICGRINYISKASNRFFQSSYDQECLSDRNPMSAETLTNLYDHFQEAEEEFLILQNFRKYSKCLHSLDHTPDPESLTQMRNSFDRIGRRFLLKQRTQSKPKQSMGTGRISLIDSDQLRKSIASAQFENEISQRKLSTVSNSAEYSMVKVNYLTVPAEKITIHGNHLGELTLTAKLIIFDSVGETEVTDESILIKAPDFCRITSRLHNVYSVKAVAKVLPKTYLHTNSAIELYFKSGRSVLFNVFTKRVRDKLYTMMSSWNLRPGQLIKEITRIYIQENYTRKWQAGLMSNFEYILTLNTLSGRSFHDTSSYPVFPWVLRDYSSPTLDLANKKIFRKLHYPIGAQTRHARETLTNKLAEWKDEDIPPFHYGSHYSSAGVVTHFMLRIEPFTTEAAELQGGAFDLPERLFFSLDSAWSSGAMGLGDCKELIPEIYYLPELSLFRGEGAFGLTQSGESIREVIQPRWALNPLDFTIQHAEMLESRPVKEKLRHWIDLVFGCNQQGKMAQKSFNLFYFFTDSNNFEMAVHKNPNDAELFVSQAYNFGQNPVQLFTKGHPKMLNICESKVNSVNSAQIDNSKGVTCFLFTVDQVCYSISVENRKLYVNKLSLSMRGSGSVYCVQLELSKLHRTRANGRTHLYPYVLAKPTVQKLAFPSPSHFAVLAERYIVSCCYPDNSFRLHSLDGKLMTVIKAHCAIVTCVVAVHNYMFTGSVDSLILWWKLKTSLKLKQQYLGHTGPILALATLKSYCLLASLSTDNKVLVHELRTGELLQSIAVEHARGLFALQSGFFGAFSASSITIFSANGYQESYSPSVPEQLQRVHCSGRRLILCGKRKIYFSEAFRRPFESITTENEVVWSGIVCSPEPTLLYSCRQPRCLSSSPWRKRGSSIRHFFNQR